jgi:non-ribosomal peptide synthetase component F
MNQFAMTYVWWEILVKSVRLCYNLLVLLYRVKSFSLRFIGKSYSFIDDFERRVRESPNHVQFITVEDGRELTLAELDSLSNRIAHWMMSLHLKPR